MSESIAAVIVTHNRKELFFKCLDALFKQDRPLDAIFIIDNDSTDGTPELLYKKKIIETLPNLNINEDQQTKNIIKEGSTFCNQKDVEIIYIRKQNDGSSGGFHEGMKQAYNSGYDWIWFMDDDVIPNKSCLLKLAENFEFSHVLIPLRLDINGNVNDSTTILYKKPNILSKLWSFSFGTFKSGIRIEDIIDPSTHVILENFAFEGPMINRQVIEKVGLSAKNLFILYDDTEYALRIQRYNASKILLVSDAILVRMLAHIKQNKSNNWKLFFEIRNSIAVTKKYYPRKLPLIILKQLRISISSISKLKTFFKALKSSINFKILID